MLKGVSLSELARKIEQQQGQKQDYIVDTAQTAMVVADKQPLLELPEHGRFPIRPLAHQELGERVGIPSKYYDRMLTEAPQLLADNVNTWFRLNPRKNMVRTMGGNARAFLSNKYQRIENEDIAKAALPVLRDLQVKIVSAEITEKRMYIHFALPGIQGEVKKGDVVQAGGIIANSEVGCGAASVSGLLWRLICLNGMKTSEQFRRTHVGRAVEDDQELWADDTRAADDTTILLKIRDMVKAVVDEARFKANLAKMQGLTQVKLVGRPEKAVEVLAKKAGLNEGEGSELLRSLIDGGDLSAWGMLNAVTGQAHKAKSYDRAVELEAAGGALLELPASEWKQVLEAA